MITSVTINGLRGIRQARLSGLTPISVLVGKNGCGKSTVLDALAIASSPSPSRELMEALARRTTDDQSLAIDWFLTKGLDNGSIVISGEGTSRSLVVRRAGDKIEIASADAPRGSPPIASVSANGPVQSTPFKATPPMPSEVRFIDLRSRAKLRKAPHELYSEARAFGRKKAVLDLLRALVPGIEDLEILTIDNKPALFLSYPDRAVPLSLSGDGVRNVTILAFELGAPPNSLVLVEEPETHLHPGAMMQAAELIIRAVRAPGGAESQVVLATHSLEFIDALIRAAQLQDAAELLSVHRLSLQGGVMSESALSGDLVLEARSAAEMELR